VIDFLVLNIFLWALPTTDTWRVLSYNSLAVLLAATNSFFWNKYWTFRQSHPITLQEVLRFATVAGSTILMNDLLMWLLSGMFPGLLRSALIGANVLKLSAIIGTMSVSFFGMRLWVFFQRKYTTPDAGSAHMRLFTEQETVRVSAIPVHKTAGAAQLKEAPSLLEQPGEDGVSKTYSGSHCRQRVMKTLIIIPTYNERENLPLLLKEIFRYAPETDVLIVDDNSPDGTGKFAEEIHQQNSRVHVLHRPGKLGLGTAYIAGFKHAIQHGYDAAFEMDADFSHDPRYLPDFLKAIEYADLVIGSRYVPGGSMPNWSFTRRLISGSGNIFARFVLGIPVHDCTGGFRCYRRHVLQNLELDNVQSRGYAFQVELTYRVLKQRFKIVETPITFMDRRLGKSKMSRKIVIEAFTYVLRTRLSEGIFFKRRAAIQRTCNVTLEHRHVEELVSLAVIHASLQSLHTLALPVTPLPETNPKETQTSNIRPIKLMPLQPWDI
jgi:dolichol-phosphate mannosyltransferase